MRCKVVLSKMYCSWCGNPLKEGFKFCVKCGNEVGTGSSSEDTSKTTTLKPPTLNSFMLKKKNERIAHFKPKKGKSTKEDNEEVTINIGLMRLSEDFYELKALRGKNLPIKVRKSASSKEILTLGIAKHAMHNSNDIVQPSPECYKLLYPDGTVVDKLKESNEPFTLCKYKCEIGKPYQRLTFFICSNSDYAEKSMGSLLSTGIEISDDEVAEVPEKKSKSEYTDSNSNGDTTTCETGPINSTTSTITYKSNPTPSTGSTCTSNPTPSTSTCTSNPTPSTSACTSNPTPSTGSTCTNNPTPSTSTCTNNPTPSSSHAGDSTCAQTSASPIPYSIIKDIFPNLSDLEILEALKEGGDVENTVHNLSEKTFGTTDQIDFYSSILGQDDDPDSDEFMESVWNIPSGVMNSSSSNTQEDAVPFHDQLQDLFKKCTDSKTEIKLKVRRSCVWEDTLLKLKRCNKEALSSGIVKVQFIGEPAVDEGGPRKELFYLIHRHMQSSSLFSGEPQNRSFTHNIMALQKEEFYYYGVLSALSVVQGSPGPTMFSSPVADYIISGKLEATSTSISDLPVGKIKSRLEELENITDPEIFKQEASFNTNFRFKAGYCKPIVKLEDKDEMIRCVCLHYLVLSSLPEIEQFLKGININGVLDVIRSNPEKSRKLLMYLESEKLSADKVDALFKFWYSPMGSNKRSDEEAIAFNFTHYLEDVEADMVTTTVLNAETGDVNTITVELSHVLQFITGCPAIPAAGFDAQLSVMFVHDEPQRKLTANTCSCTLNLPVSKVLTNYESFRQELTECMFNSPGFGQV